MRSPLVAALALVLLLSGCPREVEEPEPGEARPCEVLADCNGGRTCADVPLEACVDGLCEEQGSLVRPCPGSGEPFPPDAGDGP